MVGSLKPARFYGRALPRPRIYSDVKFSDARVDPPESVNGILLEWAGDAPWRMGGLSHKRKRMQGKIEGRMSKLRAMEESEEEDPSPNKHTKGKQSPHVTTSPKMTPIERMLASPSPKAAKASLGRRNSGEFFVRSKRGTSPVETKHRKIVSRRDPDSESESEDGLEQFLEEVEVAKQDPDRNPRRSARLQQGTVRKSSKSPCTPDAKLTSSQRRTSPRSDGEVPVTPKTHLFESPVLSNKRSSILHSTDSESESDSEADPTDSDLD